MRISETDWSRFREHLQATLDHFAVPEQERGEVLIFVEGTKDDIVEA